jgi:hypothetical protein
MKLLQKILITIVVLLVILVFLKNIIIQSVITSVGSKVAGAKIELKYFSLSLLTQRVHMKGLKVYNPPGFPNEYMVDIPEVDISADVPAFLGGKIHLRHAVFNLKEMVVIKNREGKLNVDSLKVVEDQKKAAKDKGKEPSPEYAIQIDELKLNVERVVYKDLSKEQPTIQTFDVGLKDKSYKDIKSVQQLITVILVSAMKQTAIQSAGLYAAATVLGAGFLPAGIVGAIVSNDSSIVEFKSGIDKVYNSALALLKEKGEVKSEDKSNGVIRGKYSKADLVISILKGENGGTKMDVSARQMMLPKPHIAGGFVYELQKRVN